MKYSITLVVLAFIFVITNTAHATTNIGNGEPPSFVPEPSTLLLMAAGVGAVVLIKRLRNRRK